MSEVKLLSRVQLFATPWTVAYQAHLSIGFSRQEYWSGLPFPSPGDLPDLGIEPRPSMLQADTLPSEPLLYKITYIQREESGSDLEFYYCDNTCVFKVISHFTRHLFKKTI